MNKQFPSQDQAVKTTPAASAVVQRKLALGAVNDPLEHEADVVAGQVMRMVQPSFVQRKCAECEEEEKLQRKPVTPVIQRSLNGTGDTVSPAVASKIESAIGNGAPMPDTTKSFMEHQFGADFSGVRIHADDSAAGLSRELQAHAFTVGSDIFFNTGKFSPESEEGGHLLAHELTHTIQQGGKKVGIQREYAVAPAHPELDTAHLTATQNQEAIAYNVARITDPGDIALIRDVVGLDRTPPVIDADFVNAVAVYQAQFGETSDGQIGSRTMARLIQEIDVEAAHLVAAGQPRGSLDVAFALQTQLEAFMAAGNTAYDDYKAAILSSTVLNRRNVLMNTSILRRLAAVLPFEHFAQVAELLGRVIPGKNTMLHNAAVQRALAAAFADSDAGVTIWSEHVADRDAADPCNPPEGVAVHPPAAHEEGGWVYLNLITEELTTRRAAAGAQAGLMVDAPVTVADSIVIGIFHTHPNVGVCWSTAARPVFLSPADIRASIRYGVPIIARGAFPTAATAIDVISGPDRQHLAGGQLFPGRTGGIAPQASLYDAEPADAL